MNEYKSLDELLAEQQQPERDADMQGITAFIVSVLFTGAIALVVWVVTYWL
jgi:hypothetical protein